MALTRKQLALVFAKLREKGLLKYIKKGPSVKFSPMHLGVQIERGGRGSRLYTKKEYEAILSPARVKKLLLRIPEKHRKLSTLKKVELNNSSVGEFNLSTGTMRLGRFPGPYSRFPSGYGNVPLHVPFRPRRKMTSEALHLRSLRNAKVGATKTFYHEFAHSIWGGVPREIKNSFAHKAITMPRRLGKKYPKEGLEEELFSDYYSMLMSGKISRIRLRRQDPEMYRVMVRVSKED